LELAELSSPEHGSGQECRREGLRYRTDFVDRVAIGPRTVIELPKGPNLALVAVHHAEYQRLIGARPNALLRRLSTCSGKSSAFADMLVTKHIAKYNAAMPRFSNENTATSRLLGVYLNICLYEA